MNRIQYAKVSPETYRALLALETYVRDSSLERGLRDLVYLRVSQQNGCAFCVDMHAKDLRAAGETPDRLALLVVWREATCFTERERAALAFAEALTSLGGNGVPDEIFENAKLAFGEPAVVQLALAVATINAWNRMGVAFRAVPGAYQPEASVLVPAQTRGPSVLDPAQTRGPSVLDPAQTRGPR